MVRPRHSVDDEVGWEGSALVIKNLAVVNQSIGKLAPRRSCAVCGSVRAHLMRRMAPII